MEPVLKDHVAETALAVAAKLFASSGVEGTSLGTIAKAVGISKGTLYYHFPTKMGIVESVAEMIVHDIGDKLFAWVDSVKREAAAEIALDSLCDALLGDKEQLRIYIAISNAAEPNSTLELMLDRAIREWGVMLDVGILRINSSVSDRMKRVSAAILPFMCGLAALNADTDYAKTALRALIIG